MSMTTTTASGAIVEDSRVSRRPSGKYYVHPVTNAEYPSVTTVIGASSGKRYLIDWAAKLAAEFAVDHHDAIGRNIAEFGRDAAVDLVKGEARRLREERADFGSYVHDVVETLVLGGPLPDMTPEHERFVDAFIAWWIDFDPTPLFTETTVCKPHRDGVGGHAGTADLGVVITLPGGRRTRIMVDVKTGANIEPTMAAQLSAYLDGDEMWLRSGEVVRRGDPDWHGCEQAFILHLREDGYRFLPVATSGRALAVFHRMLANWHWENAEGERLIGLPLRPPLPDGSPAPRPVRDLMPDGLSKLLEAEGLDTCEKVAAVDRARLMQIKGVKDAKADKIAEYLAVVGMKLEGAE